MTTNTAVEPKLSVENTKELAETLTNGVISADNQNEDRIKQRLERFGKIAPEAKKISRALRFGTTHEAIDGTAKKRRLERFGAVPNSLEDEQQKKRQRTDRFHIVNPVSTVNEETKKKRIDRFGVVTPPTTLKNKANGKSASITDAIKKRAERFGDISQAAKINTLNEQKVKRAERFKPITSV